MGVELRFLAHPDAVFDDGIDRASTEQWVQTVRLTSIFARTNY
jgi:hypothetical protein